jgi:glycosyltransferase involved in cell wall biosynthesis
MCTEGYHRHFVMSREVAVHIIYAGPFTFPRRNAAAQLALSLCTSLTGYGFAVTLIGVSDSNQEHAEETVAPPGCQLEIVDTGRRQGLRQQAAKSLGLLAAISSRSAGPEAKLVIAYNPPAMLSIGLVLLRNLRGVKVVAHCTEWYASPPLHRGVVRSLLKRFDTFLRMHVLNRQMDALIVTSDYLREFYRGSRVLVVPSLSEPAHEHSVPATKTVPVIAYAGNPFHRSGLENVSEFEMKDRLDRAIDYLSEIKQRGIAFEMKVFGLTEPAYLQAVPRHAELLRDMTQEISFHGFLEHKFVEQELADADFTILMRDSNRVSLAGFPTKFAESVNFGTPVITDAPGDVRDYLEEGWNGFALPEDPAAAVDRLGQILSLPARDRLQIKSRCREFRALRSNEWSQPVGQFLMDVSNVRRRGVPRRGYKPQPKP